MSEEFHGGELDAAMVEALKIKGADSIPGVCNDCLERRVEAHVEGQIGTLTDEAERQRAREELIKRGEPFQESDVTHFLLRSMLRGSFYLGMGVGSAIGHTLALIQEENFRG
jgi:hypothetical protein